MSSVSQVLRQADTLKVTVSDSTKGISELWVTRQRLEDLYKKILLMDLEYALDKKVEQDLWNHAFKNQINVLQSQAKDKLNLKRGESQASLNLFLENASGFYLQFLQLVCTTFKLDLPFRRKSAAFGVMKEKCPLKTKINPPTKNSCYYICQHCLVHLGDIARYRQQIDQAKTYYRHAANLVPQNGQPYNQMAILEAARGNKLLTVFYYIRSLDVRHPFPVAATNLEKFYTKLAKDVVDLKGKLSMMEVVSVFLQFHSLVHLTADLTKAGVLRDRLLSSLPSHITSQSFQSTLLLHFVTITIFSIHNCKSEPGSEIPIGPAAKLIQFCRDEEKSFQLVFSFLCGFLESLIQNTPKQETKAKEFFTLPAIKVILDWISLHTDFIQLPILASSSLWNHFAKLLNNLQSPVDKENAVDISKYSEQPLPEDVDLRCFRPIEKSQSCLNYSQFPIENLTSPLETQLRCHRLVAHGKRFAQELPGIKVLSCQNGKSGRYEFTSTVTLKAGTTTQPTEKRVRQNVAMQTIYQKQAQKSSTTEKASGEISKKLEIITNETNSSGQKSPKYVLGVPTTEPQFMKHGGGGRPNQSQLPPRLQNQHNQQQQQQSYDSNLANLSSTSSRSEDSLSPGGFGYHSPNASRGGHDLHSPQHDSTSNPSSQFNMASGIPPYQQEPYRMSSPSQGQSYPDGPSMPMNPGQMRMPPPPHMMPQPSFQLLNAMRMANQMQQGQMSGPNAAKGMIGMNTGNMGMMPPMNYNQGPEGMGGPPQGPVPQRMMKQGPRLPNFPAFSNYAGGTGSGSGSAARVPAPTSGPPRYTSDPALPSGPNNRNMMASFSPLTIQPPKQNIIDSRLTSTFQGHAEGTPKPENMTSKRDNDSVTQPGVYSLFNSSTPWSVSLKSTTNDTKSIGSSPFSSAASSIRNSPEHPTDITQSHTRQISSPNQQTTGYDQSPRFNMMNRDNWNPQLAAMMMTEGGSGPYIPQNQQAGMNGPVYPPGNMQQFWSAQGGVGLSPLERLLEMQRQRQHEPH